MKYRGFYKTQHSFFCSLFRSLFRGLFYGMLICFLFFLVSCTANVNVSIKDSTTAFYDCTIDIGHLASDTLKSLATKQALAIYQGDSSTSTENSAGDIFNKEQIQQALLQMGLKDVSFICDTNKTKDSFVIRLLFYAPIQNKRNITKVSLDKKTFSFSLSPAVIKDILQNAPQDFCSYVDLFCPPVLDSTPCTKLEYEQTLGVIYGEDLAKEITSAKVTIQASHISQANHKKDSTKKGQAVFDITDILLLQGQRTWDVPLLP